MTFSPTESGREQMTEVPLVQFHLPASAGREQKQPKMAVPNRRTTNVLSTLRIWQWNCRSYRPRHATLQEFVKQDPPDLIALQETNTQNVRLQGTTPRTNKTHGNSHQEESHCTGIGTRQYTDRTHLHRNHTGEEIAQERICSQCVQPSQRPPFRLRPPCPRN